MPAQDDRAGAGAHDPGGRSRKPDEPAARARAHGAGIELLGTTANRLYDAGEIGATATWSNAASGNSGAARHLDTFEREGLPCRRVEHVIKIRQDAVPKRLELVTCRSADGRWLLA